MKFRWATDSFAAIFFFTTVLCYEPEFLEPLDNVTVTQGREATFTCVVDHLGGYRVAWIKADSKAILAIHNRVITHNNRMNVIHSDHKTWELKIKNVTRNDTGQYMCQINTDPMKMQVGFLNVVIPPDIIGNETSGDVMVPEGSTVRLTCRARGFPDPEVTWRREDRRPIVLTRQEQKKTEVLEFKGSELVLERVARDDMGAYMCIASNDIPPAVSKRIVVHVHFHPLVRIPNQLVGAPVGTNVTLECEVEASPKSINYWTKMDDAGPVIVDSRKYINEAIVKNDYTVQLRLTIRNLKPQDFTTYRCTAKNSLGEVDGAIKLYEIELPSPKTTSTEPLPTTTSIMHRNEGLVGPPSDNRRTGKSSYSLYENVLTTHSSKPPQPRNTNLVPYSPPDSMGEYSGGPMWKFPNNKLLSFILTLMFSLL
ncbi:UNVERIFIED_CONTAM: hypothetical protein RMT77_009594 [Armadillidium vulgare]